MSDLDDPILLSYLAGFFEGEGTIRIQQSKCRTTICGHIYVLYSTLGNTELDIPMIYHRLFRGSIQLYHRPKNKAQKSVWRWSITTNKALNFLKVIRPYLRTSRKRELADLGIAFQEHKRRGNDSGCGCHVDEYNEFEKEVHDKMKKLNKKGA
jgi:hypothetical protein